MIVDSFPTLHEEVQTLGVVKYISVTMVIRSVAMETEVTLD